MGGVTTGIYRIALADGRCYVGQSVDIEARWRGHRFDLRKDQHHSPYLQRVWNKYGEAALMFEVLEECGVADLVAREQAWIDGCDSVFNVCEAGGSSLGFRHTPEARAKISAANKGRKHSAATRARHSAANRRRKHSAEARAKMSAIHSNRSPETRARMSAARKGRKLSPECRAKIGAAGKGRRVSPETRAKISAGVKAWLAANPRTYTQATRDKIGAGVRAHNAAKRAAAETASRT
jgi:group I intron endonuclease